MQTTGFSVLKFHLLNNVLFLPSVEALPSSKLKHSPMSLCTLFFKQNFMDRGNLKIKVECCGFRLPVSMLNTLQGESLLHSIAFWYSCSRSYVVQNKEDQLS